MRIKTVIYPNSFNKKKKDIKKENINKKKTNIIVYLAITNSLCNIIAIFYLKLYLYFFKTISVKKKLSIWKKK